MRNSHTQWSDREFASFSGFFVMGKASQHKTVPSTSVKGISLCHISAARFQSLADLLIITHPQWRPLFSCACPTYSQWGMKAHDYAPHEQRQKHDISSLSQKALPGQRGALRAGLPVYSKEGLDCQQFAYSSGRHGQRRIARVRCRWASAECLAR